MNILILIAILMRLSQSKGKESQKKYTLFWSLPKLLPHTRFGQVFHFQNSVKIKKYENLGRGIQPQCGQYPKQRLFYWDPFRRKTTFPLPNLAGENIEATYRKTETMSILRGKHWCKHFTALSPSSFGSVVKQKQKRWNKKNLQVRSF